MVVYTSTQNHLVNNAALCVFLSLAINLPDDTFSFRITDLGNPLKNPDGVQDNMAIKYVMFAVYSPLSLICTLSYLGPFVFTRTLLPLLESTAANGDDVRIVNVSLLVHCLAHSLILYI
jgi:NAD(P)-dependent dehydrogenase (short-subunit alcohol dehydrogenase family)